MAERTVEFSFKAKADTVGVDQFNKALGALDKKINDVSDKSLRALGREVLDVSEKFKQSPQNIRAAASALNLLAQSATAGSSAYLKLSGDAQKLTNNLSEITRATTAASVANQAFGGSADAMKQQISTLSQGLGTLKFKSQEYVQTLQRITELQAVMSARQGRHATQAAQAAYAGPTMQRGFGSAAQLPDFAFTPAGYQQRISELKNQLSNTEFGAARQEVQRQITQAERELKSLSTTYGTVAQSAKAAAAANRELARSQQAVSGGNAASRITGLAPPPIVTSSEIAGRQYFQNQVVRPGMLALPPAGGTQATAMAERAATEAEAQVDRARQRWERVRAKLDAQAGAFSASGARVMAGGGAFQGPSAAMAGMLALPAAGGSSFRGDFDSRGFGGGARARIRGAEIPSRILFDTSSRQDIRGGNAFAGPEFGVGYSQSYGAAPSSQLPPGYFDTRRRALGQQSASGYARTGNRFMAAGAISAGAFFGGPEGALGGLIGAAIGGPGAALGGASIGAQVGIVRKQVGEFATLEAQLTKYNIALQNVAGSQAEFAAAQAAITSANERLNIPLLQGTQTFTQLAAAVIGAGGNIADAELAFNAVNSAIKATGGSSRDVEGAMLAITQVFSKGKVSAEELRQQLGERLPGAFNLFAQSIGKTGPELDKALRDGTVGLNDLMTFLIELQRRYQGTAEEIAASSEDAGARLTAAWEQARLAIGGALQPVGAEFQESLIAFLAENEEGIKQFAEAMAGGIKISLEFAKVFGPTLIELGKFALALKASQVALGLSASAWAGLTAATTAGGVAITGTTGRIGLATAGITKLTTATKALARAWAAPLLLTVGIIGVGKILGDIGKIKEARDELENLKNPSQTADEYVRQTFRNSVVTEENRGTAISELERLTDEAQELRKRVNDLQAQANSRNQRRTSQSSARAQLATAEEQLRQNQERTAAVGQLLSRVGTGAGSATDYTRPEWEVTPDGSGSDSAADKAARDAERLAAEQRRLAEAGAKQRMQLERQVFEYQRELDEQRYANLQRLSDLGAANRINNLPRDQRGVAGLVQELRSSLRTVFEDSRKAALAVEDARQRLKGAQQYGGSIVQYSVPSRMPGDTTAATQGTSVSRLLAAANANLGLFAGQTERCADAIRQLFEVAGVAIGTTKKAWDGLDSGARLASGFFGSDIGQRINRQADLRPGDLVGFERTYGNWGPGVQTHVGMYAGDGMMFDHSSRRGLVRRPLDTFAGKFMYGVRPNALSGGGPAGSPAVRSEIGNIRAEGGIEEAQAALAQAEALQDQISSLTERGIEAYGERFSLALSQPLRDRIEAQNKENDALKLRNRLLLEGVDENTIALEERLLELRGEQAATTASLNRDLKAAEASLTAKEKSGTAVEVAIARVEVDQLKKALATIPGLFEQSAAAARDFRDELERTNSPAFRLQDSINQTQKRLSDLRDPVNQLQTIATGVGDAFGNAFQSVITGASSVREALAEMFRNIASTFAQMAAQMAAEAIKLSILQAGQGAASGGGGGILGSVLGAIIPGLAGSFGGAVSSSLGGAFSASAPNFLGSAFGGASATTGNFVMSSATFGGAFADGGRPPIGRPSLIGERGPELWVPFQAGQIVSNEDIQEAMLSPSVLGHRSRSAATAAASGIVPFGKSAGMMQVMTESGEMITVPATAASAPFTKTGSSMAAGTPALSVPFTKGGGDGAYTTGVADAGGTIRFESVVINNQEYVTRDEAERIGHRSASRGAALAQKNLQNNPKARSAAGI